MHPVSAIRTRLPSRRRLLQVGLGLTALAATTAVYGYWEACQIRVRRQNVTIPNLPKAFVGKTVAVLADFHHGPLVGIKFVREAAKIANALKPDLIALLGDFAHKGTHTTEQLPPCLEALSSLSAPLGVYAVPGNHDMQHTGRVYRESISTTPLTDLTNRSLLLTVGGETLYLAGVDDLWWGKPDQDAALKGVPDDAAVVLLSHNPDFAEDFPDDRVGLMLSGHTHGGQVDLPLFGPLWLPSKYGRKYQYGLVAGPKSKVFVSCGLGTAGVSMRINCPPEINLLTLLQDDTSPANRRA